MRKIIILLFFFILLPSTIFAQNAAIEEQISKQAATFGGRIGVAAKNISTGETIQILADSLFPTASTIKLPVLVELFYKFHDKELSPEQPVALLDTAKKPGSGILQFLHSGQTLKLIDVATLMIILSDNTATNYVIDQFGKEHDEKLEAVNSRMRLLGLKHTRLLNKIYSFATKKKIWESQRFGIGYSTPNDMMMLLEKLVKGEIVDKPTSDSIIDIMRNQQDMLMAARSLPFMEDSTLWIANKTGSLDERKTDVGIVSNAKGKYIYAIFCDGSKDIGEQVDNKTHLAIASVSRMLYEHFLKR